VKTIQMTIDEPLLRRLDALTKARKTSRSAFIRMALEAAEVVLTAEDGLPATCAANFDNLQTVPPTHYRGTHHAIDGTTNDRSTRRRLIRARLRRRLIGAHLPCVGRGAPTN
jgi:hypothetical protein